MKRGTKLPINARHADFPLFSQNGAGESQLQVKAGKRFGVVSTDSQESSQQQGLFVLFFKISFLQKRLQLWIFRSEGLSVRTNSGARRKRGTKGRLISTEARESHKSHKGRALYFAKKRVEYLPEASQGAVELRQKQGAVPAQA
jgi:hypothetical protein